MFTQNLPAESKRTTNHFLREAWRAKQWNQFVSSDSRAANLLRGFSWNAVRPQLQRARRMLRDQPDLYRHLLAIFIDHWVSQARLLANQNQPVTPCSYCNHHQPDRHHEWWTCPHLAHDRCNHRSNDVLLNSLGWIQNLSDERIVVSLAQTRHLILTERDQN